MRATPLAATTGLGIAALALAYAAVWAMAPIDLGLLAQIWFFAPIGTFGALIANATGTGGGVVFVPVFNMLREAGSLSLTPGGIVGMSFLIQCFGMSAGSLTWANRLFGPRHVDLDFPPREFARILLLVLPGCLPALLLTQHLADLSPAQLLLAFKLFSIALGFALLISLRRRFGSARHAALARNDALVLASLGVLGGAVTAVFSVGVGEFVALYLLARGYPMRASVASAVMISAITVIAGAPHHIAHTPIQWEIIALAAPGVVVGGFLARRAAYALGERRLKLGAALWILGSSFYLLVAAV